MKKLLLMTMLFCMTGLNSFAYDYEVNGIYYNLSGGEAEVTSGDNKYSGNVVIPSSVTYNGRTYSVTMLGGGAFYGCRNLTSVTIPNSVTVI